jgi:hypothetical protein
LAALDIDLTGLTGKSCTETNSVRQNTVYIVPRLERGLEQIMASNKNGRQHQRDNLMNNLPPIPTKRTEHIHHNPAKRS